jgi:hypothetical protein
MTTDIKVILLIIYEKSLFLYSVDHEISGSLIKTKNYSADIWKEYLN